MDGRAVVPYSDQEPAEEKLWRAVIARTLQEWVCGPLSYSRKAEQFLFEDNHDFRVVCSSAGMDPDRLRNRLKFIRARGIRKEPGLLPILKQRKLNLRQHAMWVESAYGV